MSCEQKVEWSRIPDVTTPCVQDIANFAVNEHNKESEDNLKFKSVSKGWYLELNEEKSKHRFYITATNNKGVVHKYEAIVLVEQKGGNQRVRTLISFHDGYFDENGEFWIEIPDIQEACVQEVAKFAVAKYNEEANDNLKYICTTQGWYQEVNGNYATLFNIRLKTKDCLHRLREYKAFVLEDKPLDQKIRTLKAFKLIPKIF